MKYNILQNQSLDEHVKTVNDLINDGWKLQHGISTMVVEYPGNKYFIIYYSSKEKNYGYGHY
jgi:hypothetical protein